MTRRIREAERLFEAIWWLISYPFRWLWRKLKR